MLVWGGGEEEKEKGEGDGIKRLDINIKEYDTVC